MPIDYKQVQATRRRTLFPLAAADVCRWRAHLCTQLQTEGFSIAEIRQVMNTTPENVRRYLAKAKRLKL